MVKTYRKGYNAERELVHIFYKKGYAVLRAPRSGRISLATPDIVAIKNNRIIAMECKFRNSAFKIRKEQIEELLEWKKRTGCEVYIAWRIPRKSWFFIPLENIRNGNVNKKMLKNALKIDDF